MPSVNGRRVLVTGAAQGLGREIVLYLASKGAHVVLWDINEDELEKTAALLRKFKVEVDTRCVNLADPKDIAAAAQSSPAIWGVINNAGIVESRLFLESSDERNELTFKVNTFASFYTAKHFLPAMISNNSGAFVTVASAASYFAGPKMVTYAASKAAARSFIEALAHEVHPKAPGVHVGVVCPSHIDTKLFEGFEKVAGNPVLNASELAKVIVDDAIENCNPLIISPLMTRISVAVRNITPERVWRTLSRKGLANLMTGHKDGHADQVLRKISESKL